MKNVENLVFFTRLLAWVISVPTTLIKVITRIIFLTLRSVKKEARNNRENTILTILQVLHFNRFNYAFSLV